MKAYPAASSMGIAGTRKHVEWAGKAPCTFSIRVCHERECSRKDDIMAKILSKKQRTLDVYKCAGAKMRLCKEVATSAVCTLSGVLPANKLAKALRALSLLNEACSEAEERMFQDHPYLGGRVIRVFFGSLSGDSASALDDEIRKMAKNFANKFHT